MTINCIVIDDEPLARKGLNEYINDVDFLTVAGEYDNPLKASQAIHEGETQLLFLDIQMPKISGLEFMKSLKQPPPVIFTTAYPQYALDGFDLNALDYLVKPISFDRFLKAAYKAKEFYEVRQKNLVPPADENDKQYLFVKADNKLVKIFYGDILFVEALQNYVCIHTLNKKYITYLTIKSVEEFLPANVFIKTHKSFIVSAPRIESIDGNDILIGTHHIPISRNMKEEVTEKLLNGKFLKR
jgi:DNA-binding LytR/AlgR family response regulator